MKLDIRYVRNVLAIATVGTAVGTAIAMAIFALVTKPAHYHTAAWIYGAGQLFAVLVCVGMYGYRPGGANASKRIVVNAHNAPTSGTASTSKTPEIIGTRP